MKPGGGDYGDTGLINRLIYRRPLDIIEVKLLGFVPALASYPVK